MVAHAKLVELDRLQDDLVMKLLGVDRSTFDQVLRAGLVPLLAARVEVCLTIHLKLACRPREYAVLPLVLEYIWLEPEALPLLLIVAQGILRVDGLKRLEVFVMLLPLVGVDLVDELLVRLAGVGTLGRKGEVVFFRNLGVLRLFDLKAVVDARQRRLAVEQLLFDDLDLHLGSLASQNSRWFLRHLPALVYGLRLGYVSVFGLAAWAKAIVYLFHNL